MKFLQENSLTRKLYLPVRGKAIPLPVYFPSISSVKTGLSPFEYFKILKALGQSHFLVSAFDIDKSFNKDDFLNILKENQKNDGPIILMDSGNYESYWIRDKSWTIENFNEILKQEISDLAFCFDNQSPPDNPKENAAGVAISTENSQSVANSTSIIPIIHCDKKNLNETVLELCNKTNAPIISIPERILGDGLLERISTVTHLRRELNKLENYVFIHLLGTGNPFSLLLFSLSGVDSFDGLEWCQTTVNTQTKVLYHFQQRELIEDDCIYCKEKGLDYNLKTLGHNLLFYNSWMKRIQEAIQNKEEVALLGEVFDSNFLNSLSKIWK